MSEKKIQRCNGCGKVIRWEQDMLQEGVLEIEQTWGYFSGKDGEIHSFCLCEDCYDRIRETFVIPVKVQEYL